MLTQKGGGYVCHHQHFNSHKWELIRAMPPHITPQFHFILLLFSCFDKRVTHTQSSIQDNKKQRFNTHPVPWQGYACAREGGGKDQAILMLCISRLGHRKACWHFPFRSA